MTKNPVKHIWFDFSETIAFLKKERHDRLRYETYSKIIGKPVNEQLISEYESLYKKFNNSNAAIFRSLGQSSNFWSEQVNSVKPSELYKLADEKIPDVLKKILKNLFQFLFFQTFNSGKSWHLLILVRIGLLTL